MELLEYKGTSPDVIDSELHTQIFSKPPQWKLHTEPSNYN